MNLNKQAIWPAIAVAGGVLIGLGSKFGSPAMIVIGTAGLLLGSGKFLRELSGKQNWAAIQRALSQYDEIIDGVRWVGKEAEALTLTRVDGPGEPVRVHRICRTKNGSWFLFEVAVNRGRVMDCRLTPYTEVQAQFQLQGHQDVYVRFFGEPKTA